MDSEANITRVNEAFQEITGYSEKELYRENFPYKFIYEGRDVDLKAFSEELFKAEKKPNFTTQFIQKGGGVIPVRVSPSVLLDSNGNLTGLYATVKDISKEIQNQQKIQDSPSKLQSISSATTQISIVGRDNQGLITSFNIGAEKLLEYSVNEILGKNIQLLHLSSEFGLYNQEIDNKEL